MGNCQPESMSSFEESQPKPVRCGCGGDAVLRMYGEPETPYCIQCTSCGITTLGYATEAEVVEAWNKAMSGIVQESAKDARGSERTAKVEKKGIYTDAIHTGYCGECGHHLVSPNDVYCPGCGAKLEWEEATDESD